jgi:hypothetical protein
MATAPDLVFLILVVGLAGMMVYLKRLGTQGEASNPEPDRFLSPSL